MKASEIKVGGIYLMKVSGTVQKVRVESIDRRPCYGRMKERTVYACKNLATGRDCVAKSASKFRSEAPYRLPNVDAQTDGANDMLEQWEKEQAGDGLTQRERNHWA